MKHSYATMYGCTERGVCISNCGFMYDVQYGWLGMWFYWIEKRKELGMDDDNVECVSTDKLQMMHLLIRFDCETCWGSSFKNTDTKLYIIKLTHTVPINMWLLSYKHDHHHCSHQNQDQWYQSIYSNVAANINIIVTQYHHRSTTLLPCHTAITIDVTNPLSADTTDIHYPSAFSIEGPSLFKFINLESFCSQYIFGSDVPGRTYINLYVRPELF